MYGMGIAKGMMVTLKNFIRPPFTIQYPDRKLGPLDLARRAGKPLPLFLVRQPRTALAGLLGRIKEEVHAPQHPRFRGEEFTWYVDRCTGCAICAKFCPLGIIRIETSLSGENMQEGESYSVDVFDIDIGRCMFCGLCVEACPYDALFMGSGFERGRYHRSQLVISVDELKSAEKRPSAWYRPQLERQKYDPWREEADWKRVGREGYRWHPKRPEEMGEEEDLRATSQGAPE